MSLLGLHLTVLQICEHYLAEVEKAAGRHEVRGCVPPAALQSIRSAHSDLLRCPQVPSIITTPSHYLFHVQRFDVALVAVSAVEVPPLLVLEFLVRLADVLTDYFEACTAASVKQHFVTVYQLLEEMCDSGTPTVCEPNALRELIPPPSVVGRLTSVMQGNAGVSAPGLQTGNAVASPVPWRRADCRYAANEVFFDVVESVDATLDSDGRLLSGAVLGELYCNARLSGMPDLTLSFANHGLLDDVRFHPSIRFSRFAADRVLSFVPPDGTCKLMSYKVRDPPRGQGAPGGPLAPPPLPLPMYVKPQFSFSQHTGRINLMVGPRVDLGKPLEAIALRVPLPSCVTSIDVSANHGTVGYDDKAKVILWDVGRIPKEHAPILQGILQLDRTRGTGGADPAAAQQGAAEGDADAQGASTAVLWDEALCIEASFKVCGASCSGLAVDSLHLVNETYKLYKGVRYTTTSGRYVVRIVS
jgi:AP-3 complex subunit mu